MAGCEWAKAHYLDASALIKLVVDEGAYSGETGHPIRGKWPPGRSEATLGIS